MRIMYSDVVCFLSKYRRAFACGRKHFFRSRICDLVRNPRARGSSKDPREILRKGRVQIPTQVLPKCHFILVVHRILNKANMTPEEHLGGNLNASKDALEDRAHVTYLFLACSTRHKKRIFRTPKIAICLFFKL